MSFPLAVFARLKRKGRKMRTTSPADIVSEAHRTGSDIRPGIYRKYGQTIVVTEADIREGRLPAEPITPAQSRRGFILQILVQVIAAAAWFFLGRSWPNWPHSFITKPLAGWPEVAKQIKQEAISSGPIVSGDWTVKTAGRVQFIMPAGYVITGINVDCGKETEGQKFCRQLIRAADRSGNWITIDSGCMIPADSNPLKDSGL